jgi:hypothetical protein
MGLMELGLELGVGRGLVLVLEVEQTLVPGFASVEKELERMQ